MEKIIKGEGMMCMHCEAHVKKALEALPGVEMAVPNHKEGIVTVTLREEVADSALNAAIEAEGYQAKVLTCRTAGSVNFGEVVLEK